MTFLSQVQAAAKAYACEIGPTPWFNAGLLAAASGNGITAGAAFGLSVATQMMCDKPKILPGGNDNFSPGQQLSFADTGNQGTVKYWKIAYQYSGFKHPTAAGYDNCDLTQPFNGSGETYTIDAQWLQARYIVAYQSGNCSDTYTMLLQCRFNNTMGWLNVSGNPGAFNGIGGQASCWIYEVGKPNPGPPSPTPPDPKNITINFTLNNNVVNVPITISPPAFVFNNNGDFNLSFPITIPVGPINVTPINFNFDLNISAGGGDPNSDPGYGNKPAGGGPKLPPADRPKPKVQTDDPSYNGSWTKVDCNNKQQQNSTITWSGSGAGAIADALKKLDQVLSNWQTKDIDCRPIIEQEGLYCVPATQFRELSQYYPQVGLWFREDPADAAANGRVKCAIRTVSCVVKNAPTDIDAFLQAECNYWENYTWQSGTFNCRYKSPETKGTIVVNAQTKAEGQRVLSSVLSRYGVTVDFTKYGRTSDGAAPYDPVGSAGPRIVTQVKFWKVTYSAMGGNYGPVYPESVLRAGRSRNA